ncbi:hypothetical protein Rsub_11082 [Raphidocelis subcapitata]|uniref:Plastid lipid-associated protein/fibrillin conserved domain-containing protein n=1 Tax=Raphidocelis subcapitata TaxID=307507 RepID=A0A2V0PM58_9CHLO|nr:hypothetical protein Rsub_11082 [Raphidocelis subcapitata]|eukprot:GBF98437.1 hypothetical protein Rsub_11082 [Raphidocelis subcapitata]
MLLTRAPTAAQKAAVAPRRLRCTPRPAPATEAAPRCRRCVEARAGPRPPVPLTTQDVLKAQLLQLVTRLNSAAEADDPALQSELLRVIESLSALSPTPRPAESALINTTWALLYTLPGKPKGDVARSALQQLLAALYDWFFKYAPILAGSAVGRRADSRRAVKARGQFQIFDTERGWVSNQAKFSLLGRQGIIQVDGPARIEGSEDGSRLVATFTVAELRWGPEWFRIPFPIKAFSPTGYIDTSFLDAELRISRGDKGSYFVARRAADVETAPFLPPPP